MSRETYAPGNSVHLLRSGRSYFDALEQLIDEASFEIHFQTYIFKHDSTGERIAAALIRASGRQVRVHLLLDAYGSADLSTDLVNALRGAGVEVRFFGKLYSRGRFHLGRRLHQKVVVADGFRSIVGGINISDPYNDAAEGQAPWLDFAVLTEGKASRRLRNICRQHWMNIRFRHLSTRLAGDRLPELKETDGASLVRVSQNDYVRGKNETAITYRQVLRNAEKHVFIVGGYFLPGGQARRLLRKAVQRGVKVTLLVAEHSDVTVAIYARRYLYDWLLRNRIRIFEYLPANVHGKLISADGRFVSIGSFDLNNLSTYSNVELNLDIADSEFTAHVDEQLAVIIANECREITEEVHRRKDSLWRRLLQWMAYRVVKTLFVLSVWVSRSERRNTR